MSYIDFSDDFVEFLVLRGLYYVKKTVFNMFSIGYLDNLRRAYERIKGGSQVYTAGKFVEKHIRDGLRGFYLDADAPDYFGTYMDVLDFAKSQAHTETILVHFYVPFPHLMTQNEHYLLTITTQPFNPSGKLYSLEYRIKLQRKIGGSKSFEITLIRVIGSTEDGSTTLSIPPCICVRSENASMATAKMVLSVTYDSKS